MAPVVRWYTKKDVAFVDDSQLVSEENVTEQRKRSVA
jgi:hypothetical protein